MGGNPIGAGFVNGMSTGMVGLFTVGTGSNGLGGEVGGGVDAFEGEGGDFGIGREGMKGAEVEVIVGSCGKVGLVGNSVFSGVDDGKSGIEEIISLAEGGGVID